MPNQDLCVPSDALLAGRPLAEAGCTDGGMRLGGPALLQRITTHRIDDPDSAMPFTHRLARENHWDQAYALRVVREYLRFAYLAIDAGHPVTPSDAVDQAWHLHLLYTRDYWDDFCPNALGMPLHHGPTRGGQAEGAKYHDWYSNTLAAYRKLIGIDPPRDIWPLPDERFGDAAVGFRVVKHEHWCVRKPACIRWWARRRKRKEAT